MPTPTPRYKLGKLAPKFNPKTLKFASILKKSPAPAPKKVYWEYKVSQWGMMANDTVGDCTCAAIAHMLMSWTAHTENLLTPTDADVLALYSAITGYDPSDPNTDQGAAITDVLDKVQTVGFLGHKIAGWVQIDHTNLNHVKQAIYAFGVLDVGVQLPNNAQDQTNAGKAWDVVSRDGGIDGGHCVPVFGYGAQGTTCVTWSQLQEITWPWWLKYVDEAYAPVSLDWIGKGGTSPSNLNLAGLNTVLAGLKV